MCRRIYADWRFTSTSWSSFCLWGTCNWPTHIPVRSISWEPEPYVPVSHYRIAPERIFAGKLSARGDFSGSGSCNGEIFMGRRYFNEEKASVIKSPRADFSWVRYFNATTAERWAFCQRRTPGRPNRASSRRDLSAAPAQRAAGAKWRVLSLRSAPDRMDYGTIQADCSSFDCCIRTIRALGVR